MGVEEELLVVDPAAASVVPRAPEVIARLRAEQAAGEAEIELFRHQLELQTEPHSDLARLRDQLVTHRRAAGGAASAVGLALAAGGTSPTAYDPAVSDDDRYRTMVERYAAVGRGAGTCGLHVHVAVDSDDEGVAVIDRIGPWLSTLVALSANSPFEAGADTGHASWRTMQWGRLPTAGPTPAFGSVRAYREVCDALVASGAAGDQRMLYFDARLAIEHPTVEVRVADAVTEVDDAVLLAALARGLVETAARDAGRRAEPGDPARPELVRAGRWLAARHGPAWALLHPVTHERVPVAEALDALVDHVRDALDEAGDTDLVRDGIARCLRDGGAARQRAAYERTGETRGVLADLVERTTRTWS